MFAASFHTLCGDDPDVIFEIDFRPFRVDHLAGTRGCENKKLERRRACPVNLPEFLHEL